MNSHARETDENSRIRRLIAMDKSALPADGGAEFNRLIFAASPYLLQHADNPVDWYPWGEEAFARAVREDKPVMVSIGYATCHWCHVMAHESFQDPQVAEALNRLVVAIKVDREERPDLDSLYMAAARVLTGGSAGWPLNIFLTPERHPFYAATYIPKQGRNGMPGFVETLEKLDEVWRTRRELIHENCAAVATALSEMTALPAPESDAGEILDKGVETLVGMYDFINGGFGDKPKFPLPHYLTFLLRMWRRTKDPNLEEIIGLTLCGMRDGGICDQLGFGFHRYAVDSQWRIPHFEKMLYDQALIATAYLEAYQAFDDPFLKETALEIFRFVLGEMASPEGGFYSGLDADSEGGEGRYYLWTPAQIEELLGGESARLFCQTYGVTAAGNFEGGTILHLPRTVATVAREHGLGEEELHALLMSARSRLLQARAGRPMPFRDEKIIAGWNGLMIAALARGAAVSGQRALLDAAGRAASCLESRLRRGDGRLLRSCHRGDASVPAFLEDYAFLCWGMIELYQASAGREYLEEARRLAGDMLKLFRDGSAGGFFDSGADVQDVPVRMKGFYDGAIPSGNSIACLALLKLGKICDDDELLQAGRESLEGCLGTVKQQPVAHLQMVNALDFLLGPDLDVTLVGDRDDPALGELAAVILRRFIPGLVLRYGLEGEYEGRGMVDGRPTAHICARGACRPPVNSPAELELLLDEIG